jgi:hypothetical protein
MPDTPVQQQPINIEEELSRIASSFRTFQPQQGRVQGILGGIQNALAILASKDPASTIGQQQQAKQASQERLQALMLAQQQAIQNFRFQDLANRIQEQRDVNKEMRSEEFTKRAEVRAEDRDVRNYWREQFGREDIENLKFKQAKDLTEINFQNSKTMANQNNEFAEKLANLQSRNERLGSIAKFTLPILYSGKVSGDQAYEIYKSIEETGKISPQQGTIIGKAAQQLQQEERNFELRKTALMHRSVGGAGGGSKGYLDIEEIQKLATKIASTEELYRMPDGTVQFGQRNAAGMIQPPDAGKRLSLAEATQYVFNEYVPIIQGFGRTPSNPSQGGNTEQRVKNLEKQIEASGSKDPVIISEALDQLLQQNPADAQAIEIIKTRLRNSAPAPAAPTMAPVQQPGISNTPIGKFFKSSVEKGKKMEEGRIPQY